MKKFVEKIMDRTYFTQEDASAFIHSIGENEISEAEIASVLTGIQLRGVSLEELDGFRQALLERSIKPELDTSNSIDLCGTGGDGKDTFNISTTSSLVLAAMGQKVIKHGNYGVSSSCGSSNVLEELGFHFSNDTNTLSESLTKFNICFLHAPLFHPTLKNVAPIRKNLGVRTIFNSLGPLVNPVQPPLQLTGTFSLELAKIYQHILRPERTAFKVVFGMDGFDEVSLTDTTRLFGKNEERTFSSLTLGLPPVGVQSLHSGGTIHEAARLLRDITFGKGTEAQNQVVAANVALARTIAQPSLDLKETYHGTHQFILSGQTAKHFKF